MVSLSNGENHYEEKGAFKTIKGELSPWQRLIRHVAKNGLRITSLAVYTDDGRYFNLPSAGKNPKFKAFGEAEPPRDFNQFRQMAGDVLNNGDGTGTIQDPDIFTVIEAQYEDHKLQLWVDNKTLNCWTLKV
jgi:hypothetical protein